MNNKFCASCQLAGNWGNKIEDKDIGLLWYMDTLYRTTRRHITEERNFHSHRCKNRKSKSSPSAKSFFIISHPFNTVIVVYIYIFDFRKKKTLNKIVCFYFLYKFVWNNSHSKKKWTRYDHKRIMVFTWSTRYSCPYVMKHKCLWTFTDKELFLCTWTMQQNYIYYSTTPVRSNNKARYFQYNFQAHKSLADEVLCRSGCMVRNLD
jgi:hypothetical protein